MTRAIAIALLCGIAAGAQSTDADRFEVASIHATASNPGPPKIEFLPGGGFRAANITLTLLIEAAYEIRPEQLSGGPGWADSQTFTIQAKAPQSADPDYRMTLRRLQALLADRFHLVLNRTAKTRSGYSLVVAKGGHKMKESTLTPSLRQKGMAEVQAQAVSMDTVARFLSVHLHDDVVNRTGLTGRYDFTLRWELMPGGVPGGIPTPNTDSILTALPEQLGLKLEREKVDGESFVIVQAEKPADN